MAVVAWAAPLVPGSGAAGIRRRCVISRGWNRRFGGNAGDGRISLWGGEDAADGKDGEAEEGIFERYVDRPEVDARVRDRSEAPWRGLVPERWRGLQQDLNRTKRQKRRELLKNRRVQCKEEKARLREKMAEIIDMAIEDDKVQGKGRVRHTIFHARQGDHNSSRIEELDRRFLQDGDGGVENSLSDERITRSSLSEETRKVAERKTRKVIHDDHTVLESSPENVGPYDTRSGKEKWMPLHTLALPEQSFLVADLMLQEAHADNVNEGGVTGLYRAVRAGRFAVVKYFIRGGADVFYRDKDGASLLHHAVASGNPAVVRLLLKLGIHINSVDKAGWTPLHVAVQCQKKDILSVLINRGADWKIANEDGNTPLDLAARIRNAG